MEKPEKQAQWFQIVRMAMSVTQLGLSVAAPLVLCVLAAFWLRRQFALGGWVMVVGLVLGLGGMGLTFYKYLRSLMKTGKKKERKSDGTDEKTIH